MGQPNPWTTLTPHFISCLQAWCVCRSVYRRYVKVGLRIDYASDVARRVTLFQMPIPVYF